MANEPKKVRVLALHGMGTNGYIFNTQTAAFRRKLPDHFTFAFPDAPSHCAPAPGIQVHFPDREGYYAWWPHPWTIDGLRGAHQHLDDLVAEHGPVDIVMGFSLGCALVGSYLLYHERERPDEPLPFKAAVFICGGVPLHALEDLGVYVAPRARVINDRTHELMQDRADALVRMAANPRLIQRGVGLWDNVEGLLHDPKKMPHESDVFGLDFRTMPDDLSIRIPTVHIYGAKDPRWPAAMQLAYFCEKKKMYDHGGGHEIPRTTVVSETIAKLLVDLAKEVECK